jgi:hypothetical protein
MLGILGAATVVLTFLSQLTETGRQARRKIRNRLSRRPSEPRTRVTIHPKSSMCFWSIAAPVGRPPGVAFEMQCTATNLTNSYPLEIVEVRLRGVKGAVEWETGEQP